MAKLVMIAFLSMVNVQTVLAQTQMNLLTANFTNGRNRFYFQNSAFSDDDTTSKYAKGRRYGSNGGRLAVLLGGVDSEDVSNITGGWKRTINVPKDTENIRISFNFNVTLSAGLDAGQFASVLARFGTRNLGTDGIVRTFRADGDNKAQRFGVQTFRFDLGPSGAGSFDLCLGGLLSNKKNFRERVNIQFDDVSVDAEVSDTSAPSQPPVVVPLEPLSTIMYDANFSSGVSGFAYIDGVNPDYGTGRRDDFNGGSLRVKLGGVDTRTVQAITGKWMRNLLFARRAENVRITLRYRVLLSGNVDRDEFVNVVGSFEGKPLESSNGNGIIATVRGNSDSSQAVDTGLRTFSANIGPIDSRSASLVIGAALNKKNSRFEHAIVWFDDILITVDYEKETRSITLYSNFYLENFSQNTTAGFRYIDDAFRGTQQPDYADGSLTTAGGSLGITLGGVDDTLVQNMSGGWVGDIYVPPDEKKLRNVNVRVSMSVTLSAGMEAGEFVELRGLFGGRVLAFYGKDVMITLNAEDGLDEQVLGPFTFNYDLGNFDPGNYELRVGAFLNSKDSVTKKADVRIESVFMSHSLARAF